MPRFPFSRQEAQAIPGQRVFATDDAAVADANPEFAWLILDPATSLSAPTGVSASAGDGTVGLTWTVSANADGHRVYRSTTDDFGTASQVGSDLGAGTNSYDDGTAVNGTTYFYWIAAFDTETEVESVSVTATPSASTTFSTDFSEYATGSPPSDWTVEWDAADVTYDVQAGGDLGGQVLNIALTASGRKALSWDDVGTPTDVEILAKVRRNSAISTGDVGIYLRARGAGTSGDETSLDASVSEASGDDDVRVSKYVNGSFTAVDTQSTLSETLDQGVWYWIRHRINGNTVKVRAWLDTDSEPGTWQIDTTTADPAGAGWVGLGVFSGDDQDCDYFAVATGGGTAPSPP